MPATTASTAPPMALASFQVWAVSNRPSKPSSAAHPDSAPTASSSQSSHGTCRVSRKLRTNSVPKSSHRLGITTLPRSCHQGHWPHR